MRRHLSFREHFTRGNAGCALTRRKRARRGEWSKVFPDQAMTVAFVDRLVHHATIFEMNVESYRRRAALERKRGRGRPSTHVTIAANP